MPCRRTRSGHQPGWPYGNQPRKHCGGARKMTCVFPPSTKSARLLEPPLCKIWSGFGSSSRAPGRYHNKADDATSCHGACPGRCFCCCNPNPLYISYTDDPQSRADSFWELHALAGNLTAITRIGAGGGWGLPRCAEQAPHAV